MVSITKEATPWRGKKWCIHVWTPFLPPKVTIPYPDLLVLRVLRSMLCLAISVKRKICRKWDSQSNAFSRKKVYGKCGRPSDLSTPQVGLDFEYYWILPVHTWKIFISYESSSSFYYWLSCSRRMGFVSSYSSRKHGEGGFKDANYKKKKKGEEEDNFFCLLCCSFYSEPSSHPNSLLSVLDPHPPSSALHSSKPWQLLHPISGSFLVNIEKCFLPSPPPTQPLNRWGNSRCRGIEWSLRLKSG